MALDYTVVMSVRQRFVDSEDDFRETSLEIEAPSVGAMKEFSFSCPKVDRSQHAILQFQSLGITHRKNILQLNGTNVFGGLSRSIDISAAESPQTTFVFVRQIWMSHHLLIQPGLLQTENTLQIEARNADGDTGGNLDSFIIDNITVLFKTRTLGGLFGMFAPSRT